MTISDARRMDPQPAHPTELDAPPDARLRIMRAAYESFVERGYERTSTLAIASRARVSKRELYTLFGSKQAILTACVAERAAVMRAALAQAPRCRSHAELIEALTAFGISVLRELCRPTTIGFYRLAIAEAERAPQVARALHGAGFETVDRAVDALMAAAREDGLLTGQAMLLRGTFFMGLLREDVPLHLLLGLSLGPDEPEMARRSVEAARLLVELFGRPGGRSAGAQ
jgi:AcrR family transcriptional regulator